MSNDKKDHMGDNSRRDGGLVEKVAKSTGVDRSDLKRAIEELKPPGAGKNNLSPSEIKKLANELKKK